MSARYAYRPAVDHPHRNGAGREKVSAESAVVIAHLRKARIDQGVKQSELAVAIGVTPSQISDIESGRHEPSLVRILRIARALGIETLRVDQ